MANQCKSLSKRKSKTIGIRVTSKEKERIEKIARIQKITVTELVKSLFDELLDGHNPKNKLIWELLDRAIELIDQEENKERNSL
mgnify:CR=1 FL=1